MRKDHFWLCLSVQIFPNFRAINLYFVPTVIVWCSLCAIPSCKGFSKMLISVRSILNNSFKTLNFRIYFLSSSVSSGQSMIFEFICCWFVSVARYPPFTMLSLRIFVFQVKLWVRGFTWNWMAQDWLKRKLTDFMQLFWYTIK